MEMSFFVRYNEDNSIFCCEKHKSGYTTDISAATHYSFVEAVQQLSFRGTPNFWSVRKVTVHME